MLESLGKSPLSSFAEVSRTLLRYDSIIISIDGSPMANMLNMSVTVVDVPVVIEVTVQVSRLDILVLRKGGRCGLISHLKLLHSYEGKFTDRLLTYIVLSIPSLKNSHPFPINEPKYLM